MKQSRKPHFVLTDRRLSAINKGQDGSPTLTLANINIHIFILLTYVFGLEV
jgi:hypothetical protein